MCKAEGGVRPEAILAYPPREKRLVNAWAADHTTNVAGGRPLMAFDMRENAYHMDYNSNAGANVDNFMHSIGWDVPAKLYAAYAKQT